MKTLARKKCIAGGLLLTLFAVWTVLIQTVDVQPIGANGTNIGFATVNRWFHQLTGVHMVLYTVSDWLGLVPLLICLGFAVFGLGQWVRRKNIWKVEADLLVLGVYYLFVFIFYVLFESFPINYRPVLIDGALEASYPSSTTLLVLCVMPTLVEQTTRRTKNAAAKRCIRVTAMLFSAWMVLCRSISGVHWLTDIIGAMFLSAGSFALYQAVVAALCKNENN